MKKKLLLPLLLMSLLISCEPVESKKKPIAKAYINTGKEVLEVDVDAWRNYKSNKITIFAIDGTIYSCDMENVTLIQYR